MVLYKNIAFLPLHPSEMAVIIVHGCLASSPAQEATTRHLWLSTPSPLAFPLPGRAICLRDSPVLSI